MYRIALTLMNVHCTASCMRVCTLYIAPPTCGWTHSTFYIAPLHGNISGNMHHHVHVHDVQHREHVEVHNHVHRGCTNPHPHGCRTTYMGTYSTTQCGFTVPFLRIVLYVWIYRTMYIEPRTEKLHVMVYGQNEVLIGGMESPLFVSGECSDQFCRMKAFHVRHLLRFLEELPVHVDQLVVEDLHTNHGHEQASHHEGHTDNDAQFKNG